MGVEAAVPSLLGEVRKYLARGQVNASCFAAVTGRLDYPVSGLVIIAKDAATADILRRQQEDGTIKKTYHAIVSGAIEPRESELTHWLLKSKRRRSVSAVSEGTADAQIAKLRYIVSHQTEFFAMLSVNLLTGRKHQIRVQLSEMGHAVLGDRKYKSTSSFPEGIALICKKVSLLHPVNGRNLEWELDYPPAWNTILAEFGADRSK
jgi:23S rRNA pseudouridine1911/1915/1917 synthase